MKPLRIALTKGRLEKDTVALLEQLGYDCGALRNKGRRLILPVGNGEIEAVLAKAADVITYVEHGVCDLGVVGKDTILENGTAFFELLALENAGSRSLAKGAAISSRATIPRQLPPNTRTSRAITLKTRAWTSVSLK